MYVSNNDQTVKTADGQFMLVQRNAGYAVNDGKWVVTRLPGLHWSNIGTLRRHSRGGLLGICDDLAAARALIASAGPAEAVDEPVTSMGRASC